MNKDQDKEKDNWEEGWNINQIPEDLGSVLLPKKVICQNGQPIPFFSSNYRTLTKVPFNVIKNFSFKRGKG